MPQPPAETPLTGAQVASFMARETDIRLIALCDTVYLPQVRALAAGYTRGAGFTFPPNGPPTENYSDIQFVITAVIARLASNPAQFEREGADGYLNRGSFSGFTFLERLILDAYRRTTV